VTTAVEAETGPVAAGYETGVRVFPPAGNVTVRQLLLPKWISARGRGKSEGRTGKIVLFALAGFLFWAFAFGVVFRLLQYFRGILRSVSCSQVSSWGSCC
jgi:hypothetical protein